MSATSAIEADVATAFDAYISSVASLLESAERPANRVAVLRAMIAKLEGDRQLHQHFSAQSRVGGGRIEIFLSLGQKLAASGEERGLRRLVREIYAPVAVLFLMMLASLPLPTKLPVNGPLEGRTGSAIQASKSRTNEALAKALPQVLQPSQSAPAQQKALVAGTEAGSMTKLARRSGIDPVLRTLGEALGGGVVFGVLVVGGIATAFQTELASLTPILTIAGGGAAIVAAAFIYEIRR